MNKEQYERAINVLLSALERLGKEAIAPAQYEAMAKIADTLIELHVRSDRDRVDIRGSVN